MFSLEILKNLTEKKLILTLCLTKMDVKKLLQGNKRIQKTKYLRKIHGFPIATLWLTTHRLQLRNIICERPLKDKLRMHFGK